MTLPKLITSDHKDLPSIIKNILETRIPKFIRDEPPAYRHAGVLIPLLEEDGIYKVIFTKRTDTVEHHKGQISFPGGSVDEEDVSVEQTALREAREEIGLETEDVEMLGRIDDALTLASKFIVHPFVGLIPYPYDFSVSPSEVETLIMVPLDVFRLESAETKRDYVEFENVTYRSPVYAYNDNLIWGA
ncbi:MAG: CoA pyrophosphatase, partial [Thermodesulfobacteriota bacterium]|nr:CoA pyrophosphatase [Thermodesulfobacteriota bacterium]